MRWSQLVGKIMDMINNFGIPSVLIIHCGGNDIGSEPCGGLLFNMKFTIAIISRMLPFTALVYSSILPRRSYRYSSNDKAMEHTRKRINRGVRSYILKYGGYVIKHPDFDDRHKSLFCSDGVHLSFVGNDIFINQFQSALETFLDHPHCSVFPYD